MYLYAVYLQTKEKSAWQLNNQQHLLQFTMKFIFEILYAAARNFLFCDHGALVRFGNFLDRKKKHFGLFIRQLNEFRGCAKARRNQLCHLKYFFIFSPYLPSSLFLSLSLSKIKVVANMYAIANDSLDFFVRQYLYLFAFKEQRIECRCTSCGYGANTHTQYYNIKLKMCIHSTGKMLMYQFLDRCSNYLIV